MLPSLVPVPKVNPSHIFFWYAKEPHATILALITPGTGERSLHTFFLSHQGMREIDTLGRTLTRVRFDPDVCFSGAQTVQYQSARQLLDFWRTDDMVHTDLRLNITARPIQQFTTESEDEFTVLTRVTSALSDIVDSHPGKMVAVFIDPEILHLVTWYMMIYEEWYRVAYPILFPPAALLKSMLASVNMSITDASAVLFAISSEKKVFGLVRT